MQVDEGRIIKLGHQFQRARKLADTILFDVKCSHFMDGAKDDHWQTIASLAGIHAPSEETKILTLGLLQDRAEYWARVKAPIRRSKKV